VAAAHVFVDADRLADECITVDGADGHHLVRVRRLGPGEVVTVADGIGRWRVGAVDAVDGDVLVVRASGPIETEPVGRPRLAVAFAPTKGDQPERVVAALTELGVEEILPVITRRSVVRWSGERAAKQGDRLRRVAREAAAQCRRATLPSVADPAPVASLAGRRGVVIADRDGGPFGATTPPEGTWTVVVGPEGGLDPEDVRGFGACERMGVGPHILRADTAPIAIAAVLATRRVT
jgi:16S rRNA (uracil1498-N3)-methyltransferase